MTLSRKRYGATLHNQYYARPEVALSNSVVRPSVLVSVPLISSKILTIGRTSRSEASKQTHAAKSSHCSESGGIWCRPSGPFVRPEEVSEKHRSRSALLADQTAGEWTETAASQRDTSVSQRTAAGVVDTNDSTWTSEPGGVGGWVGVAHG